MDRIVSLKNAVTTDDVHIKYFHRRQRPLACEVELSSTSQASRRSMPGTDYVSAINVHICRSVVSGRAGGYAPGMSAAYENQGLLSSAKQRREMTKLCAVYGTWTTMANFSHFHSELYTVVAHLT